MMEDYINIKDFKDGHAYYIERSSGRIAVADMGRFGLFGVDYGPKNTDDGVLYLDFTKSVEEFPIADGETKYYVPLTPDMGATCNMVVSKAERDWILETFRW